MPARRNQPVEGVLFDWDGTLIDSYHADTSAYLAMFKEMGIAWGLEELEKHYSPNCMRFIAPPGCPGSAGMTRTAPGALIMRSTGRR
jgi:hypothetical protein